MFQQIHHGGAADLEYTDAMGQPTQPEQADTFQGPPRPPPITPEDRVTLKRRISTHLTELEKSARWLEVEANLATGTLSKLYSPKGRSVLDLRKLKAIADALQVQPVDLVEDTAFAAILLHAPETQEAQEVVALRAQIDDLRTERAALGAEVVHLRSEVETLTKDLVLVTQERDQAREEKAQAEVRLENVRVESRNHKAQLAIVRIQRDEASKVALRIHGLEAKAATHTAQIVELGNLAQSWRTYALDRNQRVLQLEGELASWKTYAQQLLARQGTKDEFATAFLAGLAGLGIGVAVGAAPKR